MCGLCGVFLFDSGASVQARSLDAMMQRLVHRGPDGRGGYVPGSSVGLGHRRLAIIDLERGEQPVANETGTVQAVFNGEIYNHAGLRSELETRGHRFRSRCDSEVLVHLYEELGSDLVLRLNGMFAFAIWDSEKEVLTLARDRLGIKPLYYYRWSEGVAFSSELRSLMALPEVPSEVDPESLYLYLLHEFVPAPRTILSGVRKMRPAEIIRIGRDGELSEAVYWRCPYEPKVDLSDAEAQEEFLERLDRAVDRRLMSDVPLGAFLSGGIDSSTIVYLMRQRIPGRLRTFSIGFEDSTYDELPYARTVANRLGTEHHEEVLTLDGMAAVDVVSAHLDEPLGDASAVPTYLVSRLARRHVKVCLSGDGGDELLAGYERHLASWLARNVYGKIPGFLRRGVLEPAARRLPTSAGKKDALHLLKRFVEGASKDPRGRQLRWQTFLPIEWEDEIFTAAMLDQRSAFAPFEAVAAVAAAACARGTLDRELAIELGLYLPDDILTKVDRMSMAVSLEARVPFLDHELVEFTARLPETYKMRFGRGKSLLRRVMRDKLPTEVLQRRKQGFGIPVRRWLRDELHDRVADTFSGATIRQCPWLDTHGLLTMLESHRRGDGDHSHELWSLFMFGLWLEGS